MSIILDALRRGRGRSAPGPKPNAAQTDAVLHTLGYGRFNPSTPFNRLKRLLGFAVLAVVAAIALWGAVVWMTQTSFKPAASGVQTPAPVATTSLPASQPSTPPGFIPQTPAGSTAPVAPVAPVAPIAPVSYPAQVIFSVAPFLTLPTRAGRKHARHVPFGRRGLGYAIPAEPDARSLDASCRDAV